MNPLQLLLRLILTLLGIVNILLPLTAQEHEAENVFEESAHEETFVEEPFEQEIVEFEAGVFEEVESEGIPVVLYIYNTRFSHDTEKLTLSIGEHFTQNILLEEKKHLYHAFIPFGGDEDLRLTINDHTVNISIPETKGGPLFIGLRHPKFFPHDLEVWTKEDVLQHGRGLQVKIEGELPIGWASHVSIEVPYLNWPDSPGYKEVKLEQADDWKKSEFSIHASLANHSLVFLRVGERLFPIAPPTCRRCYRRSIYVEFAEEKGQLVIKDFEDENAGQAFLNERYGYRGMTENEYQEWVAAFSHSESGNAFIRQLQQEMVDFGKSDEEMEEKLNELIESIFQTPSEVFRSTESKQEFLRHIRDELHDYGRIEDHMEEGMGELLHILDLQGESIWDHAFARAFRQTVDHENHHDGDVQDVLLGIGIPGFMLSLLLFLIATISIIRKPQSFFTQHFTKIEFILQGFLILILLEGVLFRNYGYGIASFSSVYGWLLFITGIVSFYINVYFLTPDLFGPRKLGRYLMNFGLLCLAILSAVALHAINPFEDLMFLSVGGDWRIVEWPSQLSRNEADEFVPFQVLILIFSTIYGIGRNVLLRRLPQLTQKSNALNAELGALKHQISPHFFFNSLNTVYSFSLNENSPKTAEAITKLSDMMRFVIYQGSEERIPLERELNYLEDYIELQRLRLDPAKHQFSFRIDGDPTGLQIAPLVLITLIENAFKHGVSMSQPSFIYISLLIQEGGLILSVENSNHAVKMLAGEDGLPPEGGVGLANTRQRLDLLYPNRYDWHVQEKGDTYFTQLSIDLD